LTGVSIIDGNHHLTKVSSRGGPRLLNAGDLPQLAKLLFTLGLRRAPPLSEILRIAASDNPTVRGKALTFFLDNLSLKYPNYDPHDYRDLAFVPAVRGSEKLLSKPFEVRDFTHHSPLYLNDAQQLYAAPEWAALGFPVVDPVLHDGTASKLKLQSHPPTSELVALLERSPPGDEATARQWFEVLSGRGRLFRLFYLKLLSPIGSQSSHKPNYGSCPKRLSYPSSLQETRGRSNSCNLFSATFLEQEARSIIRSSSPSWILARVPIHS
jgi:hypothetical protein